MMNSGCRSIVMCGIDRLGKSTQTKLLVKHLRNAGYRVAFVKSPYNDRASYRLIYWMLRNGTARTFPNLFQVVHFANKLFFQTFVLPKLLRNNDYIVFDRWCISMFVYGVTDGASVWLTDRMMDFIAQPDYTIILDGDPHINTKGDSYENDYEYQRNVRALYLNWVVSHPCCVGQVNANQPVQAVFRDILEYLNTRFNVTR